MNLQDAFDYHFPYQRYEGITTCPYRVCPIGAHIDHQQGIISGFALDKGVKLIFTKSEEPIVELYSLNFEGQIRFTVKREPHTHNNWGDYARAAMKSLFNHGYDLKFGFSGVIEGSLPIGGLSSSAAVVLAYIATFCRVNDLKPSSTQMIDMAFWAEKNFIGLNIGRLDQSCEVYCEKDKLLYLDTLDGSFENIARNMNMPDFKIGIFFSGVPRALVNSAYNFRVDECKSAAYSLKAYSGIPYGKFDDTYLRDVPEEIFRSYADRLPDNFRKRAEHYYSEIARVKSGVKAWKRGDIHSFGNAILESGNSSIYNYECGSNELKTLHEIILDTPGVYGGRFSGAGFKGCCMAVINPLHFEEISDHVTRKYLDVYPNLKDKFSIHICDTADGVSV